MVRCVLVVVLGLLAVGLVGCDAMQNYLNPPVNVSGGGTGGLAPPQDIYTGPRARIAVSAMTGQASDVGRSMGDMLVNELVSTNRFVVLERAIMPEIANELNLSKSGMTHPSASTPSGQLAGADLLIVGNITGFQPNADGISTGGLGIGRHGGGGVDFRLNRAYVAMDLRIVDVRTSAVVATARVSKYSTDWGIGLSGVGGRWGHHGHHFRALGGSLGIYQGQPMEKAIRACLQGAVQFICAQTPPVYYRYDPQGNPLAPAQPPAAPGTYVPPAQPPMQPGQPPAVPQPGTELPPAQPGTPPLPPQGEAQPAPPPVQPGQPGTAAALPAQVYVTLGTVRVYQQPDPNSAAIAALDRGTALRVTGQQGEWYGVQLADGRAAWVLKAFTSTTPPQ